MLPRAAGLCADGGWTPSLSFKPAIKPGGVELRAMTAPKYYLPPPERCERFADMAARFGGGVEVQSAEVSTEYALPERASGELLEFWRAETSAVNAPEWTGWLPGGRVFGAGIVLAPDAKTIARDVSLDFGKPFGEHWLLNYGKIGPPKTLSGATVVTATTLGTGYAHWLLEELPRLLSLDDVEADTLIAHTGQPWHRGALALMGWKGAVVPAERDAHFYCERLVVPSLRGTVAQPTRRALDLIRGFATRLHTATSAWGERIYVTRENASRRKLTNEPELWAALQSAGFSKVRLEELTWTEQINAFRHARIVVAPHGAGLANVAFCRPDTVVIELFNRAYVSGCFWRLAALRRLDYRPVVPLSTEPLSQAMNCNRLNISADIAQLRVAMR